MQHQRPSRSSVLRAALIAIGSLLLAAGCASAPVVQPRAPEAEAAVDKLERRAREFQDLRTLADLRIRRDSDAQRLSGVLLLRAPASLRFEALTAFGIPVMLVAGDASSVTLWEVVANEAYIVPATPSATRRWLGLELSSEDVVAVLAGRVLPMRNAAQIELSSDPLLGSVLRLVGADGEQRIWLDPTTGQARQVEWTGGKTPARVTFDEARADGPPAGLKMMTLDNKLEVVIRYREPRMNTGLDPSLLPVSVPERVKIRDFR